MIIQTILSYISKLFQDVLQLVPSLPQLPNDIVNTIDDIYNFIFAQVALVNLFIPIPLCITLITLVISVMIFKFTWGVISFILTKLHILG